MNLALQLIFRWIHIGSAITVVGGTVFMLFVLLPAAKEILDEEHLKLRAAVLKRWKWFVHFGIALFLVSGLYNYIKVMVPLHKGDGLYHALMGVKMLLAMGVFGLAEVLVGRSKLAEKLRQNASKFLTINLVLAAIIVMLSGFLKTLPAKPAAAVAPAAVSGDSAQ
jgi:uncharacterized membrane protein